MRKRQQNELFGGGVSEGSQDVWKCEYAFEAAKIGAADNREHGPVAESMQGFFE